MTLRPPCPKQLKTVLGPAANTVLEIIQPQQSGLDPLFRMDALILQISARFTPRAIVPPATHLLHRDQDSETRLWDSICSGINLRSPSLGDVIETMSLGTLIRLLESTFAETIESSIRVEGNAEPLAPNGWLGVTATIRIPLSPIKHDFLRELCSPQAAFFDSDGLEIRTGSYVYTDDLAQVFDVSEVSFVTYAEGRSIPQLRKTSPLYYRRKATAELEQISFGPGVYFGLFDMAETPATVGASGFQLIVDGTTIQSERDSNGAAQMVTYRSFLADPSYDARRFNNLAFGITTPPADPYVSGPQFRRPFPIAMVRAGAAPSDLLCAEKGINLKLAATYPATGGATRTFGYVQLKRTADLGNPKGYSFSATRIGLPGLNADATPDELRPYCPQIEG